jgi:hypothetical protein
VPALPEPTSNSGERRSPRSIAERHVTAKRWWLRQVWFYAAGLLWASTFLFVVPSLATWAWLSLVPFAGGLYCALRAIVNVPWRFMAHFYRDRVGRGIASDGIDKQVWRATRRVVLASSPKSPRERYQRAWNRWGKRLPALDQKRLSGLYVVFLLKHHLAKLAGGQPSAEDLQDFATRISPEFRRLMPAYGDSVQAVLLTAFDLVATEDRVKGAAFQVQAVTALGLLLRYPSHELALMRNHVGVWCRRNEEMISTVIHAPDTPNRAAR